VIGFGLVAVVIGLQLLGKRRDPEREAT